MPLFLPDTLTLLSGRAKLTRPCDDIRMYVVVLQGLHLPEECVQVLLLSHSRGDYMHGTGTDVLGYKLKAWHLW